MKILKIGVIDCADCTVMTPRFKEVEQEYPWLETKYFEASANPEIVAKYKVLSLPSFIFLDKQGNEILRMTNIVDKEVLVKAILENKDK